MMSSQTCIHQLVMRLIGLVILMTSTFHVAAQNPTIWCDVLNFQHNDQPFVEIHLEFESSFMTARQDSNGWRTNTEIQVIIESGDNIVAFSKSEVYGASDSTELLAQYGTQFHLERIQVASGSYRLHVSVRDLNDEQGEPTEIQQDLVVPSTGPPQWSDVFLVGAYAPSDETSLTSLSRSGFDMLPLVGAQFSADMQQLQFYGELYHVDEVVDSLFLISSWMESNEGVVQSNTRRYYRKMAAPVVPVFTSIPMEGVNWTQGQNLIIQAATRDNQVIAEKRLSVQLMRDEIAMSPSGSLPSYIRAFTDSLALLQHVKDHHPLGDNSEQQTIDHFIEAATVPQMQAFLTDFWQNHAPSDPEFGWRTYVTAVAYSDSLYGACRNGHGAMTDMGYVYLRYGPPNTVVKRHNGTDYYPYEIWHYHRAGSFTNKRFLFFSPHMIAECFVVLHSDMLGEVQNNDWLHILKNRENSLRVTESQLNRLNPRRDTFSGEEPEDLFFNPR
jgi:GWxTD domain-containing protein